MKPWQAAKIALEQGAPLDDFEQRQSSYEESDSEDENSQNSPSSFGPRSLIYPGFATYPDEFARLRGEIFCQEHRPNKRPQDDLQDQIIKIDEAIMWQLKPLEEKLERLYLLREIRNELYYLNDSEEKENA